MLRLREKSVPVVIHFHLSLHSLASLCFLSLEVDQIQLIMLLGNWKVQILLSFFCLPNTFLWQVVLLTSRKKERLFFFIAFLLTCFLLTVTLRFTCVFVHLKGNSALSKTVNASLQLIGIFS